MNRTEFEKKLNEWGSDRVPFLFITDFELNKPEAYPMAEIDPLKIKYNFRGVTNDRSDVLRVKPTLASSPISFDAYKTGFDIVSGHLRRGDSFLTNLTIRTPIKTNLTLEEIFRLSDAKYRLLVSDEFVVFSPEPFVRIDDGIISSFPMKGTIDASIKNAKEIILQDKKELSEHITIVDLIRNDISQVSANVSVSEFRYVEELKTHDKTLLQVSSRITGQLEKDYHHHIGSILMKLLPAGSVSGAPKARTLEIIRAAETVPRGFYTGVCGYFDGTNLDSAVMIRFIENDNDSLYYRSGGGITAQSIDRDEYEEAIKKIYVPVN